MTVGFGILATYHCLFGFLELPICSLHVTPTPMCFIAQIYLLNLNVILSYFFNFFVVFLKRSCILAFFIRIHSQIRESTAFKKKKNWENIH
jgi:hypothetical protein